jgi:hypothetical protein
VSKISMDGAQVATRFGASVLVWALMLTSCSSGASVDPDSISRSLQAEYQAGLMLQDTFENRCMRQQGFEDFQREGELTLVDGMNGKSPAKELLSLTDVEIQQRIGVFDQQTDVQADPLQMRARFSLATVAGVQTQGGCNSWAEKQAEQKSRTFSLSKQIYNSLNTQLSDSDDIKKEVETLNSKWKSCLDKTTVRYVTSEQ